MCFLQILKITRVFDPLKSTAFCLLKTWWILVDPLIPSLGAAPTASSAAPETPKPFWNLAKAGQGR